jgi:hypothetical protein
MTVATNAKRGLQNHDCDGHDVPIMRDKRLPPAVVL